MVLAGVVVLCSLALIRSLDRPFSGVLKIDPTALSVTAADIGEDFANDHGAKRLPCNARGEPLDR